MSLETRRGRYRPWVKPVLLAVAAALVVASNLAIVLSPVLVKRHPAALIALSARNSYLATAGRRLDPATYYLIGFLRLVVADPVFYLLGRLYGAGAIRWLEERMGERAALYRWCLRAFEKVRYGAVALFPNNPICLLAGATSTPWGAFVALNASGTVVRLVVLRLVGDVFSAPLDSVVDFVDRNRMVFVVAAAGLVLLKLARQRRGGSGEISNLNKAFRDDV